MDPLHNSIESKKKLNQNDSITFSVRFSDKETTGFNIVDTYSRFFYLEFANPIEKDTVITKRKLRIHDNEIVNYLGGRFVDGKIKFYNHYYLLNKDINNLEFEFENGDVILKNQTNIFIADSLFIKYNRFSNKTKASLKESNKKDLEKELDNIFNKFKKRYLSKDMVYESLLNEYHYFDKLQIIKPTDIRIENYLKQIDTIIVGRPLNNLLFFYSKNRVNKFDYKKLNNKNYSKKYIELISIGIFNFLRHEDNKGDKKYQPALDWLKTTNLYKQDSIYIKKEITPLDNLEFKNKLKNLNLLDTSFNKTSFSKILKENPSNYYLIDFWATWCAPCIEGIKIMKKKEFPKNVKIISLSLDKLKVKDKWKTKTKELEQKISFLVDEMNTKNKEFLKFIELQSVPRYILIDKNMNLIDQAFYHPQESQFLPRLKDVKYSKH